MNRFKSFIARVACLGLLVLAVCAVTSAQDAPFKINYRLDMSHPASHLFEVTIELEEPGTAVPDALDFQMPKWSPGRYAVFDFAKNVQEFSARGGICPPPGRCDQAMRPVTRVNDQT